MIEEYVELPRVGGLYRRAVLGMLMGRPGGGAAPTAELLVRDVAVDREHLARYARVCGFRLGDSLPPTYPHVLAFPLMLELMTRTDFPFVVTGLLHIANVIEQDRAIAAHERLDLSVRAENLRDHPRGRAIDVVAIAASGGRAVWRERSTYLRRTQRAPSEATRPAQPDDARPPAAIWPVSAETGPAYAAVSGDRNPIHMSRFAARLFGFRRPIAHGMWGVARCLAALEGRVPEQCTVDVTFKAPILLPATVAFRATPRPGGIDFALRDDRSGRPHLIGTLTA